MARGVVIGVPIATVFGVLFSDADPIFGSIGRRLFAWNTDPGDLLGRAVFVALAAWLCGGILWLVACGLASTWTVRVGVERGGDGGAGRRGPRLGAVEALTILVVLDVLFAAFVALQVAYLFGGLDTLEASGMTYANYARRGFFELLAVGFLTGTLVAIIESVVVERPRHYVVALLMLVALTGAVLASSWLRLRLYQDAYGWTELRFYVAASIVFLAITFAVAAYLIVRNASRWLPNAVAAAGVVVFLAINVVGPQSYVTQQNLGRALNPSLVPRDGSTVLDTAYLSSLGADSVPALVESLPRLAPFDRANILDALKDYQTRLALSIPPDDRVAWNLARERARAALETLPAR